MKHLFFLLLLLLLFSLRPQAQAIYFPPINPNQPWDTLSPQSLGWCTDKTDSLYAFLEAENTKAFLVLKDGKIVLEKYFGTFTQDSVWYWASAGKTLTAFLVGKAQEEGLLEIGDSTSQYLGVGWTNAPTAKERLITIGHQLTMTSGLDDDVPDNHCTLDTCLNYLADAGTRWAYHNAPYTLLGRVLENATGQPLNTWTQQKLKNQTGITGAWIQSEYNQTFYSKPRSMARFGLLIQNRCRWNTSPLLNDTGWIQQMTQTSQPLNLSYGYLCWLNGKSSFRVPGFQAVFQGPLIPAAPADMVAALGKNGQILSIAPSAGLVVVRMGNSGSTSEVSIELCEHIWQKLNKVICLSTSIGAAAQQPVPFSVYPNPVQNELTFTTCENMAILITDAMGRKVFSEEITTSPNGYTLHTSHWRPGLYTLRSTTNGQTTVQKMWKE